MPASPEPYWAHQDEYPAGRSFGELLEWHLIHWGTRPHIPQHQKGKKGKSWDIWRFAAAAHGESIDGKKGEDFDSETKNVKNWRQGRFHPQNKSRYGDIKSRILKILFDNDESLLEWKNDLESALSRPVELSPFLKRRNLALGEGEDFEQKPNTTIFTPNAYDDSFANILDINLDFRGDNAFLAIPEYTPSHDFVGRDSQMHLLDEWAFGNSALPLLILGAIGGTGKSYLTWEWLRRSKCEANSIWRGRFWYSFYERGATLSEFLRCLVAFMSRRPFNDFIEYPDRALSLIILEELRRSPWLIVMDGLERLLAGYNRIDAASRPDSFAQTTNLSGSIDDRLTIRPQDTDILRAFATAQPSKILTTSRLVPACLTNAAGGPIPGVTLHELPGMEREDAIAMFRTCGVNGTDVTIGPFLEDNCGNHPLVIGALAGIVEKDLDSLGNFDDWLPLNRHQLQSAFRRMDLTRRQNHILKAALTNLSLPSWRLLSILASVSSSVGVEALKAFNPHLTAHNMEGGGISSVGIDKSDAALKLSETVYDLKDRGLLQISSDQRLFDLHPVIRNCVVALSDSADKSLANQMVIDHFSSAAREPFSSATTMEALRPGIEILHALLRGGNVDAAFAYFNRELVDPLIFNLEEVHRCQGFALEFFVGHALDCETVLSNANSCSLMNIYGIIYTQLGELDNALVSFGGAISRALSVGHISSLIPFVSNATSTLWQKYEFRLALDLSSALLRVRDPWATDLDRFTLLLNSYNYLTKCGRLEEADQYWQELDPMGRDWPISRYRQGSAEVSRVCWYFRNGSLAEQHLNAAENIANSHAASRYERRCLLVWRGLFEQSRGDLQAARNCFGEAVRAAREVDLHDSEAEAKYLDLGVRLGKEEYCEEMRIRIDALLRYPECSEIDLAELCHTVGDAARSEALACAVIKRIEEQGSDFFGHYDRKRAQFLGYDCQLNGTLQSVTKSEVHVPPWYGALMRLLDDLQSFDDAGDIPDSLIGGLGHLIHKLKAKDSSGRWAYYFVLVMPKNEKSFLSSIDGDGTIDLEDYGKVVDSCFGEEPTEEVRDNLKRKYGFDV